ncbi:MAG: hypothetical protein WCW31_03000 [Patescibacteria group bacterium]|jgi:nucleoside 2-deoxyribosyltransferase
MKLTLCGSIAFHDKMLEVKNQLEAAGHKVDLPPTVVKDEQGNAILVKEYYELRKSCGEDISWIWDRKEECMRDHFNKIERSDAVLILNYPKNDIENYIGTNTLLEMGLAFHLRKPIYLLFSVPELQSKEEILGMKPISLNGRLDSLLSQVKVD